MRITAQQYARSLFEATKGKSRDEIVPALENFVKILAKNNQLKLKNTIIEKFSQIYNTESGIVEAEVTSREILTDELRTYVSTYVRKHYGARETVLVEKTNPKIKGGVVIRVGDEVLDASIERKLRELKRHLSR